MFVHDLYLKNKCASFLKSVLKAEGTCYYLTARILPLKVYNLVQKTHLYVNAEPKHEMMKRPYLGFCILILSIAVLYSTTAQAGKRQERKGAGMDTVLVTRTGTASFYAAKFQGRRTSNGEKLDNQAYTCASYLPYDTWVRVTNLRNGKSVLVRVTDRFHPGGTHLVDLTLRAAKDIDMVRYGIARIRMEVLNPDIVRAFLPKDSFTIALPYPTMKPFVPVPASDWHIGTLPR